MTAADSAIDSLASDAPLDWKREESLATNSSPVFPEGTLKIFLFHWVISW